MSKSPVFLTIQGNIGAGKTLLHKTLQEKFAEDSRICFLPEPVSEWIQIKDKKGKNMLEKYYENQDKYAFAFQMMAYISRLSIINQALKGDYDVIVSERSLDTDKNVFALMLYEEGSIEDVEYEIYRKWFDEFKKDFPEERILYIQATPNICKGRISLRGRKGEDIPLEYLRKCHTYHEDWLTEKSGVTILDGDVDVKQNPDVLDKWVNEVENIWKDREEGVVR